MMSTFPFGQPRALQNRVSRNAEGNLRQTELGAHHLQNQDPLLVALLMR